MVTAGGPGENVTTEGIDLLRFAHRDVTDTRQTGLCRSHWPSKPVLSDRRLSEWLLRKLKFREPDGVLIRIVGIIAAVKSSGRAMPCDRISVSFHPEPHRTL